ncbi:hypothetical protein PtoMrB4_18720 [Metapseudomonas otitidis]|uniref:Uncharacterized protein n=1 Tax=Metapseudomonas otitidis TaxID=319939 RepID=A0A679GCF8_9GAMM|nr:hypothetical protein PtoMrB4_18720 [Pseudomonas otitidis]
MAWLLAGLEIGAVTFTVLAAESGAQRMHQRIPGRRRSRGGNSAAPYRRGERRARAQHRRYGVFPGHLAAIQRQSIAIGFI